MKSSVRHDQHRMVSIYALLSTYELSPKHLLATVHVHRLAVDGVGVLPAIRARNTFALFFRLRSIAKMIGVDNMMLDVVGLDACRRRRAGAQKMKNGNA